MFQTASLAKTPEESKPLPPTSVTRPKDGQKSYEERHKQTETTTSKVAADKLSLLSRKYTGEDLFGLPKTELLKRFPAPDFKHTADFAQVTWHGTDTSSVLDLRFKNERVAEVRLSTHYGYPRPGSTIDVEVGQWLKKQIAK